MASGAKTPGPDAFCPTKVKLASVCTDKPSARGVGVGAGDAVAAGATVGAGSGEPAGVGDGTDWFAVLACALLAVVAQAKTASIAASLSPMSPVVFTVSLRDKWSKKTFA